MTRTLPAVAVVAALLVASMAGPAVVTAQESSPQTITSCTTITEPGTYTLGSDIANASANPCIDIESSDVVLDGNGHSITGDGDGIAVAAIAHEERTQDPYANVTVQDLRVESWGAGVELVVTDDATVTDVAVTDSAVGVRVGNHSRARPGYSGSAHGTAVTDSTFEEVGSGVVVQVSNHVEVVDDTVTNYDDAGVELDTVNNATVRDNEIVSPNGSGPAVYVRAVEPALNDGSFHNVIESNRIVDAPVDVELHSDDVQHNQIVENDVTNGSISVSGERRPASDTLVADNRLTDSDITVWFASNVTVEDNTLANPGDAPEESILLHDAGPNTVRNNTITGANVGVRMENLAAENTVVDNRVTNSDVGVSIGEDSVNNTVAGNTLANDGNGVEVSLVDSFKEGTNYVRGNDVVNNENGVLVEATDQPLVIDSNDIRANENGIHVQASGVCSPDAEGAELVSVHENVIADSAAYGVLNGNRDVLNATENYWGASDGPSSADDPDAPFEDPVTGALANGSGTAVSEDSNAAGQSNVHFDSWLQQPPDDAGASNESAA